jgi:hypothetical protein
VVIDENRYLALERNREPSIREPPWPTFPEARKHVRSLTSADCDRRACWFLTRERGYLVNPPHMDLLLPLSGSGDVVGGLHSHERVHLHSKGFLDAERHIPGKISPAVKQAGQRGPGNLKRGRRRRYR